jgi:hypothetical protein
MTQRATGDAMTQATQAAASVQAPPPRREIFAGSVIASPLAIRAGRWGDVRVMGCVIAGLGTLEAGGLRSLKGDACDAMTLIAVFFGFYHIHAGHIRAKCHCVTRRHFRS